MEVFSMGMRLSFKKEQTFINIANVNNLEEADNAIFKFVSSHNIPVTDYRQIVMGDDVLIDFGNCTRFFVLHNVSNAIKKYVNDM